MALLNLKQLNKVCETKHFKMESLNQAVHMITPGCYMASIDIKDAFYSVSVHSSHTKYLKFVWRGNIYKFVAMPNGYIDAMRTFTKLLKPVFSNLRLEGHSSVIYVDDSFLLGDTFESCLRNVRATLSSLREFGFVAHPDKSCFMPSQSIVFLGFILDSVNMTITLTMEKKDRISSKADYLLNSKSISNREVASFVGNLTAAFVAVPYGRIYYRNIEASKTASLKVNAYNFDSPCCLSEEAKREILWWKKHIYPSFSYIKCTPEVDLIIHTDASLEGWGAHMEGLPDANGRWNGNEKSLHINCLELMAKNLA